LYRIHGILIFNLFKISLLALSQYIVLYSVSQALFSYPQRFYIKRRTDLLNL